MTAFRAAVYSHEINSRQKTFGAFENLRLGPFSFHLENDRAGTVGKIHHCVETHSVDGKARFGTTRINDRAVCRFWFGEEFKGRIATPEGLANRLWFAVVYIQVDAAGLKSFRLKRYIVHSLGASPKSQFTDVRAAIDKQSPRPCRDVIEMVVLYQPLNPCPYSTLVEAMPPTATQEQFVSAIPCFEDAVSLEGRDPVGSPADAIARIHDPTVKRERSSCTNVRYQPPEHVRPQFTVPPLSSRANFIVTIVPMLDPAQR